MVKFTFSAKLIKGPTPPEFLHKRVMAAPNSVRVGLPDVPHKAAKLLLSQLGAIHEFGSPERNIPERSFLRAGIEEGRDELRRLMRVLALKIVNGQISKAQAMEQLGLLGQSLVQQKIRRGPFEPLKPATIKRKESSAPLIDSGQMIQSVTYGVEKK